MISKSNYEHTWKKIESLTKEINFREIEDMKKKQMENIRLKTPHLKQKSQWMDFPAESWTGETRTAR